MAIEDWIDGWFIDDDEPYEVTCNRCGKAPLYWDSDGDKWVLTELNGELHKCDRMAQARAAFGKPIDI